ncbi:MAG TPA: type IV pili methyl-accepting chemotaxis transducer N-terminal domain-containing protein [Gammaproteobacteria bacterium]
MNILTLKNSAVFIAVLCLLLTTVTAHSEINTLAAAINKAGRQRMLTQSMVKDYCLIGQEINKEQTIGRLQQSIALFDSQLNELKAFAPTEESHDALIRVENLWQPLKAIVLAPASRDKVPALMTADDELLTATHKVVLLLQDISGSTQDRLVNIAGRQRMLSQRLAKLYMLRAWGFDNAQVHSDMEQARIEFKGALTELENAQQNNAEVTHALTDARRQWNLFEHGLIHNKELVPLIVSVSSDKLLITMNEITGMYELIAIRTLASKSPEK